MEREVLEVILKDLELTDVDIDSISFDAPLFSSHSTENERGLELDSIDALEIMVSIQQNFDVKITEEDMAALGSISSLSTYIQNYRDKDGK